MRVPPLLVLLLSLAGLSTAHAWDHVGHLLVAEVAAERLSPATRRAVDADLALFNARFHTDYDLVTAACWMDDVRSQTKQYDTWHYIDIELHHPAPPLGQPAPNALWLAGGCLEILAGRGALGAAHDGQPIDRPMALVFLLHLLGDLHQPLHCADNADKGGNGVGITNLSEIAGRSRNLHHFWDSAYRRGFAEGVVTELFVPPYRSHISWSELHRLALPWVKEQAPLIAQEYPPDSAALAATPEIWVREGFALAEKSVYAPLPAGPETKLAALPETYITQARAAARRQLALAGARLAELLRTNYTSTGKQAAQPGPTSP